MLAAVHGNYRHVGNYGGDSDVLTWTAMLNGVCIDTPELQLSGRCLSERRGIEPSADELELLLMYN
jgi:hypothetical protein